MRDALHAVEVQLRSMGIGGDERGDLEASLLELVINDPVTGLRNRRSLDQALRSEWRRAARSGESLGLVVIELHPNLGDALLEAIGRAVTAVGVREEDTVSRYGPSRLVALLPACGAAGAEEVAARLRAAVAAAGAPPVLGVGTASLCPAWGGCAGDLMAAAVAVASIVCGAAGQDPAERGAAGREAAELAV